MKQRVLLSVCGYNLEEYLHGITAPQFIEDEYGVKIINPAYAKYTQHENSIASWLLASLLSQVSRGLIGCMTASWIWRKLHCEFSSSSITRIMHMYGLLKTHKLVDQTMHDYLTDIQTTFDSLDNCGHPISEMQQISSVLNGVKGQFDNIIVVIYASINSYDIASVVMFYWMLRLGRL